MIPFPELLWPFTQLPDSYTVLDTETTGFPDEQGAPGIISVGVCFVSDGAYQDGAEFLTRPHCPLEDQAAAVNGFNKDEVDKNPAFADQWPHIVPWLEGQVVVMHNAAFPE